MIILITKKKLYGVSEVLSKVITLCSSNVRLPSRSSPRTRQIATRSIREFFSSPATTRSTRELIQLICIAENEADNDKSINLIENSMNGQNYKKKNWRDVAMARGEDQQDCVLDSRTKFLPLSLKSLEGNHRRWSVLLKYLLRCCYCVWAELREIWSLTMMLMGSGKTIIKSLSI